MRAVDPHSVILPFGLTVLEEAKAPTSAYFLFRPLEDAMTSSLSILEYLKVDSFETNRHHLSCCLRTPAHPTPRRCSL